jgi:DNA-binding IscR family transcriptional regulator
MDAQKAMEERLKTTTLADIAEDTKQAVGNESNEKRSNLS